jgi:hypothetical protein
MLEENSRCSDASDVIPMFPTLVWKVELEAQLHEAIDAKALAALSRVRRDLPPLAPGEGWQSIQTLHVLDNFQDLISCVHRAYLPARDLAFSEDVPIGGGRHPVDGQLAAYVCRNRTCSASVTTVKALHERCSA